MIQIEKKSINKAKFLVFLDELRRRHWADDIALFLDNLSVHHSKDVKERMEELGMPAVFNSPYSCANNPIEMAFA